MSLDKVLKALHSVIRKKLSVASFQLQLYHRSSMLCVHHCVMKNTAMSLYSLHLTLCYKRKKMVSNNSGKLRDAHACSLMTTCLKWCHSRKSLSLLNIHLVHFPGQLVLFDRDYGLKCSSRSQHGAKDRLELSAGGRTRGKRQVRNAKIGVTDILAG